VSSLVIWWRPVELQRGNVTGTEVKKDYVR